MAPPLKHDENIVMEHVKQLTELRFALQSLQSEVNKIEREVTTMREKLYIVDKDLTTLKAKIAVYTSIAVFAANAVYGLVVKLIGG